MQLAERTADVEPGGRTTPEWLIWLGLSIVVFAVFLPSLHYQFVYDDYGQIVETKQLNSLHMIPRFFTGHVWAWKKPGIPGVYYRPVFLLWLLANQTLFGLSTPWWHFTSVSMHVAATLLVFAVIRRLTADPWTSGIAALLFGLHPAHVESVDWVSGITDPLVAVLLLGSLLCLQDRRLPWSYLLFAAALLEKEIAVVWPVLILAHALLFGGAGWKKALRTTLPYVLIAMIYLGVRRAVMHEFSPLITRVPLREMMLTWPSMLLFYARHLVWPERLSVFYTFPLVQQAGPWNFWLPLLSISAITAALAFWAWRSRLAAFAAVLLIVPLLPALDLRTLAAAESVHDRYLYLPSIGFCLLVALAIRRVPRDSWRIALVIPLACAAAYGTVREGRCWTDNVTLFLRAVEVAPDNEIANQNLGTALTMNREFVEAIPYYQAAVAIRPNMFDALYSLGRIYYELGEYDQAELYCERAIVANPRFSPPYLYYGLAKLKEGQIDAAERALRRAVQVKGPDDYREFHLGLGLALKAKGDVAGALKEFQAEARENPDPSKALNEIAQLNGRE
jgi:tetratricopeptide (TPR) repeat protein